MTGGLPKRETLTVTIPEGFDKWTERPIAFDHLGERSGPRWDLVAEVTIRTEQETPTMPKKPFPVRLAIRAEGEWLNAYLAQRDTMAGAMLLGSILRAPCEMDDALFEAFKATMTKLFDSALAGALGVEVRRYVEEPAPEHERSGRA